MDFERSSGALCLGAVVLAGITIAGPGHATDGAGPLWNPIVMLREAGGPAVCDLAFTVDGTELVALDDSAVVRIWQVADWSCRALAGDAALAAAARFRRLMPSERATAYVDRSGRATFLYWDNGALVETPGTPLSGVTQVVAHRSLPLLAGIDATGRVVVIDADDTMARPAELRLPPGSCLVGFQALQRRLLVVDTDRGVATFDVESGKRVDRLIPLAPGAEIGGSARTVEPLLGPGGDWWCALLDDHCLERYRLDSDGDLDWYGGAAVDVTDLAWFLALKTPGQLLYCTADGVLSLAAPAPTRVLGPGPDHLQTTTHRAVSGDGRYVVFSYVAGAVRVLDLIAIEAGQHKEAIPPTREGGGFLPVLAAAAAVALAATTVDEESPYAIDLYSSIWDESGAPVPPKQRRPEERPALVLVIRKTAGRTCAAPGDTVRVRIGNLGNGVADDAVLMVADPAGILARIEGEPHSLGDVAPGRWLDAAVRLHSGGKGGGTLTLWLTDSTGTRSTPWTIPLCADPPHEQ